MSRGLFWVKRFSVLVLLLHPRGVTGISFFTLLFPYFYAASVDASIKLGIFFLDRYISPFCVRLRFERKMSRNLNAKQTTVLETCAEEGKSISSLYFRTGGKQSVVSRARRGFCIHWGNFSPSPFHLEGRRRSDDTPTLCAEFANISCIVYFE